MPRPGRRAFVCEGCEKALKDRDVAYVSAGGDAWCDRCMKWRRLGLSSNLSPVQIARAWGAESGLDGLTPWDNPYEDKELRRHWEEMRARVARTVREAKLAGMMDNS